MPKPLGMPELVFWILAMVFSLFISSQWEHCALVAFWVAVIVCNSLDSSI